MLIGGGVSMFINGPSVLIVFVGTIAVTFMRYSVKDVIQSKKSMFLLFKGSKCIKDYEELIEHIVMVSKKSRQQGLISLQNEEMPNAYLQSAINMMVDGYKDNLTLDTLRLEKDKFLSRQMKASGVFDSVGDAAPAFGMIGTLVGLIQMLANMEDPSTIGPAMAVAMLTTLYGAILANMYAIPIADKIRSWTVAEEGVYDLIIHGTELMYEGYSPLIIESVLIKHLHDKIKKDLDS